MTKDKQVLKKLKELASWHLLCLLGSCRWDIVRLEGRNGSVHAFSSNRGQESFIKPVKLYLKNDIRQTVIIVHRRKNRNFDYLLDTTSGRIYIQHIAKNGRLSLGYLGFLDLRKFVNKLKEKTGAYGPLGLIDKHFYDENFYVKYSRNVVDWLSLNKFKSSKYISTGVDIERHNTSMANQMFNAMLVENYYKQMGELERDRVAYQYSVEHKQHDDLIEFVKPN